MRPLTALFLATLALSATQIAGAADAKKSSGPSKATPAKQLETPFDPQENRAQVTLTHDIKATMAALQKARLRKDQFETSAEYAARTENFPLFGTVSAKDTLAFRYRLRDAFVLCNPSYNADTVDLYIDCPLSLKASFYVAADEKFVRGYEVGVAESRDVGSYVGSNAFGVKRKITIRQAVLRGLAIENLERTLTMSTGLPRLKLQLMDMPPNEAKRVIDDLGLLFVVKLERPFVVSAERRAGPTLDNPVDYQGDLSYLYVQLQELWVLHDSTGEVLRRFDNQGRTIN